MGRKMGGSDKFTPCNLYSTVYHCAIAVNIQMLDLIQNGHQDVDLSSVGHKLVQSISRKLQDAQLEDLCLTSGNH